ncbi:MAG: PAS domain S-box protein, partial [Opitutaceae bacterium]|nr:PAS domain S-box protein [Opitutaceae bacterium]
VDLICRYRADAKLTFVNGAYARAFGRKRIDLVGQPFPLLDAGRIANHESHTHESELKLPDGKLAWVQWTQRAIKDNAGAILEYQAVGHDITERKAAEVALLHAKEAAEAADRAKSDFLAVVSHEIRTPINGVIGFADMLSTTPLTPEQQEHVNLIRSSGHTLAKLISDILDLARIESGRIEIEHLPFSVRDSVAEVCAFFALKARSAAIKLDSTIAASVPTTVTGDQARLRQILINLVGNAIKFTERGSVTITLDSALGSLTDGHQAVRLFFTVTDTGVGIPADMIEKLFRPFSQVDTSPHRRREGTGLGLVISKRLCELMGGSISVESRPGEGSVFRFTLQLECAGPANP